MLPLISGAKLEEVLINQHQFAKMKILQQYNIANQVQINAKRLNKNKTLPPVKDRMLAPSLISSQYAPQLSPVGSLTNLLTDLSSTGFLHRKQSNVMDEVDKNKDIPLILAKEVAQRKQRQLSIPPVLFQSKDKNSSLKYINVALSQRLNDPKLTNVRTDEGGLHFYSPKVASKIEQVFSQPQKVVEPELRKKLELLSEAQGWAIDYL